MIINGLDDGGMDKITFCEELCKAARAMGIGARWVNDHYEFGDGKVGMLIRGPVVPAGPVVDRQEALYLACKELQKYFHG